mgnify:CR=1 FL=1
MLVTLILPQLILQFVDKGKGFKGGITQSPYGAFKKYQQRIETRYTRDKGIIDRLRAATTKEEQENIMLGASDEMREFANSVGISIEKMEKFNEDAHKTIHPIQALKAGIKGLGKVLLSYSVQFALIAGLSWAIGQIANGIDAWVNALKYAKEAAENLNKAYEDMNATQKQSTKTVEEYGKTWDKLREGVDQNGNNVSLTDDEYAQYKNAIEQISNVIPGITGGWNDSNEAIKLNISSVDDLNAKLEETLQKMRDAALTGDTLKDFNNKVGSINLPGESDRVDRARGLMNALYSGSPEKIEEFIQKYASGAKLSDSDNAILQMLEQKGYLKVLKQNPSGYARVYGATGKLPDYTAEAGTEEYKAANELVSLLEAYITSTSDTVTSVLQAWQNEAATWIATQFSSASSALKWKDANGQDLNELFSDDMQTALSNYLKSQDADFFGQFTNYSDMSTKLGKWFGEAAESVSDEATKAYQKAAEQWQSGKLSYGDYKTAREEYVDSWTGLARENGELYNMLVPYLRDYFGGDMDEYSAMRQRAQEKWNFTQEQVDSLTSEQLNYIKSLGADTEKVFTSFAAFLADFAKYQTQIETSYDGLKTKWDKATEAQTAAQEVMTVTDSNGGVLTKENYDKLIGANKAYGAAVTTIGGVTTIDSDRLNASNL